MQLLTKKEEKNLLSLARKTISAHLSRLPLPEVKDISAGMALESGCFVTLKANGQLRGCIGNFTSQQPLYKLIQEMAVAAATKDPRFYPMDIALLEGIKIEISVLSPLKQIESIDEIVVGEHGLYIEKNFNRGVLLPQVATEYGWDRDTFLRQTCLKAGLPENAFEANSKISIFSADIFKEEEA